MGTLGPDPFPHGEPVEARGCVTDSNGPFHPSPSPAAPVLPPLGEVARSAEGGLVSVSPQTSRLNLRGAWISGSEAGNINANEKPTRKPTHET